MTLSTSNRATLSSHEINLDRSIVDAVREGVHDLWHLISVLPGYYPTAVRDAVGRLVANSVIPLAILDEASSTELVSEAQLEVPGLPTPHPLDYDWRFTRRSASELLTKLLALSNPAERVLLLGVPSIYVLAENQRLADRIILLDRNNPLTPSETGHPSGGTVYCCDLKDGVPSLPPVHAVLADPPWYVDEAVGFLRSASQSCPSGATILLSFAPDGIRPEIRDERRQIIDRAEALGLSFVGFENIALSYTTPFFERNALRASRFQQVAPAWRRGDLLTFRKTGGSFPKHDSVNVDGSAWDEVSINGVRFRVRRVEGDGFADPRLKKLVGGDILPTVSRRDGRRSQALVWTSGNRVFRCHGASVFTIILRAVQASEHPIAAVQDLVSHPINDLQARLVQSTALQVKRIVHTEVREMKDFAQETAVGKA